MSETDLPGSRAGAAEALAEAIGDPIRASVIALLAEEPGLTTREISDRIREERRRVRYRLTLLRKAGLVEISGQGSRRGAIEHRYSMTRSTVFTDEDLDALTVDLRSRVALSVFRRVAADVSAATRAGKFGARSGSAELRFVAQVDQQGWEALAAICASFFQETQDALDEVRERLAQSGEGGTPVSAALFLFERPRRP